ncbi:MAG: WecB/TagA/CpsF family glycosyltransferase, partial [Dysgonamonadaceae bacterium]|nr:WecB/TagA/CpsF family glycosyltransferase [Dysgonamonadaceae bacterium]
MECFFGIDYTFGRAAVLAKIDELLLASQKGYVCVADGVTLAMSYRNRDLKHVLAQSLMTVCDSGWVPLYLRWIYGIDRKQYCGSDFLIDVVKAKKYKLMFLGASVEILKALRNRFSVIDERIKEMPFRALPFEKVEDFDYQSIGNMIRKENPGLIFVSLGMPKQEFFMQRLTPYLERGVLIGVGAAFKFHSGLSGQRRAPQWMIRA